MESYSAWPPVSGFFYMCAMSQCVTVLHSFSLLNKNPLYGSITENSNNKFQTKIPALTTTFFEGVMPKDA